MLSQLDESGTGIFTDQFRNGGPTYQNQYLQRGKQSQQKRNNWQQQQLYPSLERVENQINSTKGMKVKRLNSQRIMNRNQQQESEREDDDSLDYNLLLNQLQDLNLSDFLKQDKNQAFSAIKKSDKNRMSQAQQFLEMLKQLNMAEQIQEKDETAKKLSQDEIKSLILASYFNKILSSNQFDKSLVNILQCYDGSSRIPKYSKRMVLLFLRQVVDQIDLDASEFSLDKYKFKIEKHVPEAILFSQKIQSHFTKEKRYMIQKLIICYLDSDYIHSQAKKIIFRNTGKIMKWYKEYTDSIRPSIKNKQSSPPNHNTRIVRSNSHLLQSQIDDFQLKYPPINKKQTQSSYNYKPEPEPDDKFQVKSMFNQGFNTTKNGKKAEEESFVMKKNKSVMPSNDNRKQEKIEDVSKKNDIYCQTEKLSSKTTQEQKVRDLKEDKNTSTQGDNPAPLITSSEYCRSIFQCKKPAVQASPSNQSIVNKKNEQQVNGFKKNKQEVESDYLCDNLSSDSQPQPAKQKASPKQIMSQSRDQNSSTSISNIKFDSFSLSLSLNSSSNNSGNHMTILDKDHRKGESRDSQGLVQAYSGHGQKRENSNSDDSASDSESDSDEPSSQLIDMTRFIDARLKQNSKKIKQDEDQSWQSQIVIQNQKKLVKKAPEQLLKAENLDRQINLGKKSDQNSQNQAYRKLGADLKQKLTPALIEQFEGYFIKYEKSKPEFHVGPRRKMFSFLDQICISVQKMRKSAVPAFSKGDKAEELGAMICKQFSEAKISGLREVFIKYNSGYFHQNVKADMFADIKNLIKLYKEYK